MDSDVLLHLLHAIQQDRRMLFVINHRFLSSDYEYIIFLI
jgi:hypothetical protein